MNAAGIGYLVLLIALAVLSLRTLRILERGAPWTSAGWWATYAYCVAEGTELVRHEHLPAHLPWWCLVALGVAFFVAGIRDEPQAEPWWWPNRRGPTRRERASIR